MTLEPALWHCPACGRPFAHTGQSHTCVPATLPSVVMATWPAAQRESAERVLAFLASLGPVIAEGVSVGVFIRRRGKVAELRPKARWLSLDLVLPRDAPAPQVQRFIRMGAGRSLQSIRLVDVSEVDEDVQGLLTEAYLAAA
ncbi:MAG: hypothetical protein ACKVVT_17905 [Dehalococcoidia bacterium]